MALIKCPECGKDVSELAEKCMNCGTPINDASVEIMRKSPAAGCISSILAVVATLLLFTPVSFWVTFCLFILAIVVGSVGMIKKD